jgi:hypothetical protein
MCSVMPSVQIGHSVLGGCVVSECERKSVCSARKVSKRGTEASEVWDMLIVFGSLVQVSGCC